MYPKCDIHIQSLPKSRANYNVCEMRMLNIFQAMKCTKQWLKKILHMPPLPCSMSLRKYQLRPVRANHLQKWQIADSKCCRVVVCYQINEERPKSINFMTILMYHVEQLLLLHSKHAFLEKSWSNSKPSSSNVRSTQVAT